jgi:hypothetical protein
LRLSVRTFSRRVPLVCALFTDSTDSSHIQTTRRIFPFTAVSLRTDRLPSHDPAVRIQVVMVGKATGAVLYNRSSYRRIA